MRIKVGWLIVIGIVVLLAIGYSPFIFARYVQDMTYRRLCDYAYQGYDDTLKRMIAHGVNVNLTPNGKYRSALLCAVNGHHLSTVKLLLEAGANPNAEFGMSPLASAAAYDCIDIVKVLLNHGAHPDDTSLFNAAQNEDPQMVKLLLDAGANPNSLLWYAADDGQSSMAQMALQAQANKSASALNLAISAAKKHGHADIAKMIADYRRQHHR